LRAAQVTRNLRRVKVLVTAGPTREAIDPVRFLTNRSSGKMGYELAGAFRHAGHEVLLVSGPTNIDIPEGVDFLPVESAADMHEAVRNHIGRMDIAVFAAAVADYAPAHVAPEKIKTHDSSRTRHPRRASRSLGKLDLRQHFGSDATVDEASHHDIKLALDKESQELITGILLGARPGDALYGEEGLAGNQESDRQWIVDPIDGTVNFLLRHPALLRLHRPARRRRDHVGVIHDPMVGETWTVEKGGPPMLNGKPVQRQQARHLRAVHPLRRLRQGRGGAAHRHRALPQGLAQARARCA
jgi:hypothetical protein